MLRKYFDYAPRCSVFFGFVVLRSVVSVTVGNSWVSKHLCWIKFVFNVYLCAFLAVACLVLGKKDKVVRIS